MYEVLQCITQINIETKMIVIPNKIVKTAESTKFSFKSDLLYLLWKEIAKLPNTIDSTRQIGK